VVFAEPVGTEAVKALRLEPGVEAAEVEGGNSIVMRYRQQVTGLDVLIPWLRSRGLSPVSTGLVGLRWRLAMFLDANARQLAGETGGWEIGLRRLHVARQPLRLHGRRDERAQHWRKYLERDG
jgi:hypothetical protein